MLREIQNFDITATIDFVPEDESRRSQRREPGGNVDVVVREDLGLEPLRTIFKAAFTVGLAPQALEQDAVLERQLRQLLVLEEAWLDIARPTH